MLEVASELVDQPQWRYRQARVNLREQGGDGWPIALFGSDSPAAIAQVASGEVQVAMINPAAPLALALRGKGPFREPSRAARWAPETVLYRARPEQAGRRD